MRPICSLVGFVIGVGIVGIAASSPGQGKDAAPVLAATRQALGGDQALSAVKTFVATGQTRQVRGNNLVPIEFEIASELPSKYVRRDEVPAQESDPTTAGFNGDTLLQFPKPPGASAQAGAQDPGRPRLLALRHDFATLTLGMFATSFESVPLTFSLVGQAEAPQGTADIIDAKGPDGLALRLFVSQQTHLPIMVSWTTPATNVVLVDPGQAAPKDLAPGAIVVQAPARPPATAPKADQDQYVADVQALRKKTLAEAKPVEHRVYFADYRDTGGGVKFPFRLRRATAGQTVEETNIDGFKINARIDPKKFQSVK
jgi:hypothetical protein